MNFLIIFCIFFIGCNKAAQASSPIVIGDQSAAKYWIYLCGLAQNFDAEQEIKHRQQLDAIGRKIGVKFIAVYPLHRCQEFDNKLCWPHATRQEVMITYAEIMEIVGDENITGFIGFSKMLFSCRTQVITFFHELKYARIEVFRLVRVFCSIIYILRCMHFAV